ncbi:hypothetical protein CP532_4744 [Ophiocordyceps camponoti-leonardi (nom. inval.)]|nr:hypothetical protein CP532_4744 [Ophiocordyceps camponoti-leonardi (nom. inval.)]
MMPTGPININISSNILLTSLLNSLLIFLLTSLLNCHLNCPLNQQQSLNIINTTTTTTKTSQKHVPIPPSQHRASSGAWSPQSDQQLVAARMQGLNWGQIKDAYFPSKTANACRKRHERLMERRGAEDWDHRKLQRLAKEYMSMRREIWSGLAARTGERWNVVEHKCMSNGLKNLQSAARAASRRDRIETSSHQVPGYDDDSGISGIALTPVDELDASYNSSSETSSSAASNGFLLNGLAGHHGYSSSVSSSASGAAAGHRSFASGRGPYVDGQRMPDMGIGAIINRPGR